MNYINRVSREYFKEDDRAAATLVAAELDTYLLKLLSENLLPHVANISAPLLGRGEPLEAFGARIELSFRLSLIPPTSHHDLHIIRKIRNEFAHGRAGLSFDEGKAGKLASRLLMERQEIETMLKSKADGVALEKSFHAQNLFRMTATILLPRMFLLTVQVKRLTPQSPQFFQQQPEK